MPVFNYILWIPSYETSEPKILHKELKLLKLQDVEKEEPLFIKGYIEENLNIQIDYGINDNKCSKRLFLRLSHKNEYGFLTYELTLPEHPNDWLLEDLCRHMHKSIYHYIKGFFHEHLYHDTEEDSLLNPFMTQESVNWDDKQFWEHVLNHYLNSYILKYRGYTKDFSNKMNHLLSDIQRKKNISKNIKNLHFLVNISRKIQAETRYSKLLIKAYPYDSQSKKIEELKYACLEFEQFVDDLSFWSNHLTSTISYSEGHASLRWGQLGLVAGLISIFLTLFIECKNHSNATNNCNYTTDSQYYTINDSIKSN